jgi:hypothetical protein
MYGMKHLLLESALLILAALVTELSRAIEAVANVKTFIFAVLTARRSQSLD